MDVRTVRIYHQGHLAAEHARSYRKHAQILDAKHYEGLWNRKPSAHFLRLEALYRQAYGEVGDRFLQGLSRATLHLETALGDLVGLQDTYRCEDVQRAMEWALQQDKCDPAVVRLLLIPAPNVRPVPLSLPASPEVEVRDLAVYERLAANWAPAGGVR